MSENHNPSMRQWLIDVARHKSEEKGEAMMRLLDALDAGEVAYAINRFVYCGEMYHRPSSPIVDIFPIGFELEIAAGKDDSKWLISIDMPKEVLGNMEHVDGVGYIAAKAYQWIINDHLSIPQSDDPEESLMIRYASACPQKHSEEINIRLAALDTAPIDDNHKAECRKRLIRMKDIIALSDVEKTEFLKQFDRSIDFETIDAERRAALLKEFDEIIHPVIGDHGFPDWTRPEFIDEVIKNTRKHI